MAYDDNNGGGFQRQMHQGNWSCSKCGASITELPFEPDPSRLDQLQCGECHKKSRAERTFGNRDGSQRQPREMHQGNWSCSKCGASITELPFEPDPSRLDQLKCRDCHRSERSY